MQMILFTPQQLNCSPSVVILTDYKLYIKITSPTCQCFVIIDPLAQLAWHEQRLIMCQMRCFDKGRVKFLTRNEHDHI